MTVTVPLDFMAANALLAGCEQRLRTLRGHIQNGVVDEALDVAILHTIRAEDAIRKAFRLPTEAALDAAHEATTADLADLAWRDGIAFDPAEGSPDPIRLSDIPLALLTYMGEGR